MGQWGLALLVMMSLGVLGHAWLSSAGVVDTSMQQLLPAGGQLSATQERAEARDEQQLARQVVLLVGAGDARQAVAAAHTLAARWQASQIFAEVRTAFLPDLAHLQQQAGRLQVALMPAQVLAQLQTNPAAYFLQRAQDLVNPFGQHSILPVADDWLGLGRFLGARLTDDARLRWDPATDTLQSQDGARTWVWVQARLPGEGSMVGAPAGLLPLLTQTQAAAGQMGVQTLVAGGAIFAAQGKATGERESRWMSLVGLGGTLLLLLAVVRSVRILAVLLPLGAGVLLGVAGCLTIFGHIHILTLVIGTSLVGVMVDLPMHWVAVALAGSGWLPWAAMRKVLPAYSISLAITVAGYLALALAPLPVLRQTALFSVLALCGASAASALWLPAWFAGWQGAPQSWPAWLAGYLRSSRWINKYIGRKLFLVLALAWGGLGLWRADWHDDVRQWVSTPPDTLAQLQTIGRLGGAMAASRYLLVEAPDDDTLLARCEALSGRLQALQARGRLKGFQSLSQWVQPLARQQQISALLRSLAEQPTIWAPLLTLGVPQQTVHMALERLAALPVVSLADSLQTDLAMAWQPLYLGRGTDGHVAALVRMNSLQDAADLTPVLQGLSWASLIDRPARLNRLFRHTRNIAIYLKLVSWIFALGLLWALLGWRQALKVLAVPLLAVLATVAAMGWLGRPVSLFATFGLLLVSAIGVDYAVYAEGAHEPEASERLAGIVLAAVTSMMSFALLGLSDTPALAGFGVCVTLGIFFNLVLCAGLIRRRLRGQGQAPDREQCVDDLPGDPCEY